jgi:hypothetical protein
LRYHREMIRPWAVAAALTFGVFLASGQGQAAQAWTPFVGQTHHYYFELYRYPQGGFPRSGTLDLTFNDNGVITGYFHPSDGGIATVTGSIYGNDQLQLDFDGVASMHVNGTFSTGAITGRGYSSFGRQLYSFRMLPIPNDRTLPQVTPIPWPG